MAAPLPTQAPNSGDLTGRQLGRYEVLHRLASGGMATVYVARAQGVAGFERLVAIKVLHPHLAHDEDFISMFLDEARLAARIRHPNVVGTLDISDSQGDGYFLVMEYVEGDHFGALMRAAAKGGAKLPLEVVSRIVLDALTGLQAAHNLTDSTGNTLDLVHRDVSPHNILVGAEGVARITDFGVAKAQVRLSSTRDGQFKGKLSYMAPEQAASGEADQRSDLFSMGIVLWEALTGRRLFRGDNNADVLNKILNPDVPPPSSFDPPLAPFDVVIARALAKEPRDRFQTADEFIDSMEEAARVVSGVATPRAVGREVTKWLGEKMKGEGGAIRDAIDSMGRSELGSGAMPRPAESSQPSAPGANSLVRPIRPEDMTLGAKPSTVVRQLTAPARRGALLIGMTVTGFALLAGIAAAVALLGDASSDANVSSGPAVETRGAIAPGDPTIPGESVPRDPNLAPPEDPTLGRAEVETVTPEPEPETAGVVGSEDEANVAEEQAAPRARRERRRRDRVPREEAATEPSTDDDLMLNPYRH